MCVGGVHICRLKRTAVRFPLLFSVDLNFALYKYKYRILILFRLLNHPSRRPVLTRGAASYPPGLAALCRVPASIRGLRLARSPLRYRLASPPLAPNPGYCRPARSAAPLSPPLLSLLSSSLPCAPLYPRRPPLSLLLLLSPPAGWGGVLGAAERAGRWYPRFGAARRHCHALAGRGSAPRRPGGGARRPPFGRAAEPARSAACASPGHPPPHSARTPSTPRPCPALSSIPTALSPLSSLLLPDGLASSEPRSVRADGIPGSERSAATATRQRGGGARRVDRGEERAVPRSAELRSVRDQPPAPAQATRRHIVPSPPRAPLLPPPHPPPAKRQKKVVPTRRVGTTL